MPYNFNFKFIKNEFYPKRRNGAATWISPIDNQLYLFGGSENSNVYDDFLKYDTKKNKWTIINLEGNIPFPRFGSIHFVYKDKFYLLSGFGEENTTLRDFWVFDLKKNRWDRNLDFSYKLEISSYSSYWVINNNLYILGGLNIDKNKNVKIDDKLIIYNLDNDQVKIIDSSFIKPRFNSTFWSFEADETNYLYLLNGLSLNKEGDIIQNDDFWRFNVIESKWEIIDSIPNKFRSRNCCLKFKHNQKIYLFGGINQNNETYDQIWRFKPKDNSFKLITNVKKLPLARADSSIWQKNNKIYIFGGVGQKYHLNDLWSLTINKVLF
jgi:N-acetylneuraminic acid mutarotase